MVFLLPIYDSKNTREVFVLSAVFFFISDFLLFLSVSFPSFQTNSRSLCFWSFFLKPMSHLFVIVVSQFIYRRKNWAAQSLFGSRHLGLFCIIFFCFFSFSYPTLSSSLQLIVCLLFALKTSESQKWQHVTKWHNKNFTTNHFWKKNVSSRKLNFNGTIYCMKYNFF